MPPGALLLPPQRSSSRLPPGRTVLSFSPAAIRGFERPRETSASGLPIAEVVISLDGSFSGEAATNRTGAEGEGDVAQSKPTAGAADRDVSACRLVARRRGWLEC